MVGQVFIFPKLQARDPDWYTITKQRGGEGWHTTERAAERKTRARQARTCSVSLTQLPPAPFWYQLGALPLTRPASLLREMNLPLRKAKPASRSNVQNRKWKMSTSSKQADQQRENQLSVWEARSSNWVSDYSLPLSSALSFSPSLPQ